jgi:hypothetical protein
MHFPVRGSGAGRKDELLNWSARSVSRRWRSIFERVLAAHRRAADAAGTEWKSAVYDQVREEMKAARGLTIRRMVGLGRVSRSSFYRFDPERKTGTDRDMELRDAIQRIALEWPG